MSADTLKESETFRRFRMGQFGSKGGLQRIAPVKSGWRVPQAPNAKVQTSVPAPRRDSSVKTT
jgi:hypothetical protein